MDIRDLTIEKFRKGIRDREFSIVEVLGQTFDLIKKENKNLNVFISIFEKEGMEMAGKLDKELINKEDLPDLYGVPVAIKDNILISGHKNTCGSNILKDYLASYDATVIKRLKEQGSIFVGKTNLDEFAMGSSTEYSAFGPTRNPIDPDKVPGGSSGGSAVAVSSNMALGSLGSDTGGSIRQPAGFCGVVGLKPTYGAVSRYGLSALASSLDQIGPFGKTVKDTALIFKSIAGRDDFDSTSVSLDWSEVSDLSELKAKKIRIGIPKEYFIDGTSDEVKKEIEKVIEKFKKDGFEIKEVSLPNTKYALSCYYIILPAEASANLGRFDGIRYSPLKDLSDKNLNLLETYLKNKGLGFGDEPQRRILLGAFVLSSGYYDAYYSKAQKVRRLIINDFENVFKDVDVLLTPVTPTTAFGIGEKKDDPLSMYLSDIFTIPTNLAGLPALSIPSFSNYNKERMPINFQLIGKKFKENEILSLGDYYENYLKND